MEQGLLSLTKFNGGLNYLLQSQPSVSVPDHLLSPTRSYLTNAGAGDLFGFYSPLCSPSHQGGGGAVGRRNSASLSQTPSTISVEDDERLPVDDPTETERRLLLARLMLQYQEVNDRYDLCLSHYRNAVEEAEALRQENAQLRLTNAELMHRLAVLTSKRNHGRLGPERTFSAPSRTFSAVSSIADDFRRFGIGGEESSPTSVLGELKDGGAQFSRRDGGGSGSEKKMPLPKSISIRPSGFLKLKNNKSCSTSAGANRTDRLRVASPVMMGSEVLIGSGSNKKEREEEQDKDASADGERSQLELDVYSQGTFKTELCNKWEELGECPYGENCQFAHGIAELRPVIRHPRYKTEVCRMVLAGDTCPYGHRCHFRHAVSAQDLVLLQNPSTSVNTPHL